MRPNPIIAMVLFLRFFSIFPTKKPAHVAGVEVKFLAYAVCVSGTTPTTPLAGAVKVVTKNTNTLHCALILNPQRLSVKIVVLSGSLI